MGATELGRETWWVGVLKVEWLLVVRKRLKIAGVVFLSDTDAPVGAARWYSRGSAFLRIKQ